MLNRRSFIAILGLPALSIAVGADRDQARPKRLTTVTLLIDGMT